MKNEGEIVQRRSTSDVCRGCGTSANSDGQQRMFLVVRNHVWSGSRMLFRGLRA